MNASSLRSAFLGTLGGAAVLVAAAAGSAEAQAPRPPGEPPVLGASAGVYGFLCSTAPGAAVHVTGSALGARVWASPAPGCDGPAGGVDALALLGGRLGVQAGGGLVLTGDGASADAVVGLFARRDRLRADALLRLGSVPVWSVELGVTPSRRSPARKAAAWAPTAASTRRQAILGGVLGSGVGAGSGWLLGRSVTAGCTYDDCDIGGALGYVLGGWMGGAVGAHAGARRGGDEPSFGRAVAGSTLGVMTGILSTMLVGELLRGGGLGPGYYGVAAVVVHGATTGLVVSRGRR